MRICLLATGDELVKGIVEDTNSPHLARTFGENSFEVVASLRVRDRKKELHTALTWALERSEIVLATGGLGPTQDDINREVVAEFLNRALVLDPKSMETLRVFFCGRGFELTENNKKQAYFPEGAHIFENPLGTAPGFAVQTGGKYIVCAPGVPRELFPMVDDKILPFLRDRAGMRDVVSSVMVKTFGHTESKVDEMLQVTLHDEPDGLTVGLRASFPEIHVILSVSGKDPAETGRTVQHIAEQVEEALGEIAFGRDHDSLESVVGRHLRERGLRLVVAESCTGGLIADRITRISGSSEYFLGGVVAYHPQLKTSLLQVKDSTIECSGIVSLETALEMARGALQLSQSRAVALAVTGWMEDPALAEHTTAGPRQTNLCSALVTPEGSWAKGFHLFGDRAQRKLLSSQIALEMLRRYLQGLTIDHWPFRLVTEERKVP